MNKYQKRQRREKEKKLDAPPEIAHALDTPSNAPGGVVRFFKKLVGYTLLAEGIASLTYYQDTAQGTKPCANEWCKALEGWVIPPRIINEVLRLGNAVVIESQVVVMKIQDFLQSL